MQKLFYLLLAAIVLVTCKKEYDVEPTYANPSLAQIWAQNLPFYRPNATIYLESSGTWRTFIGFTVTSDADPNKLGFANPYNAGKGTNALYMTTLYTAQNLTSDSGFYNVTIPKCLELIPNTPGAKEGTVNVIPQQVRLTRRDRTFFDIGIKGNGTYSEITKLIEIEVDFDETSIGGPASIKRKYRFLP
jgi:hypothetical protein